jgi:transposase-like protein
VDISKVAQQYRLNQWAQRIREFKSSGQTVAAWCAEHNIRESSYFYWLKRVREAACEALPSLNTESNQIIPVSLPLSSVAARSADEESSPDIVIRIGAVTMEVHNNASQILIENTLRALHNVR